MATYPNDAILPELNEAVRSHPWVVLHAPPGAGKTTRVPLSPLDVLPPGQDSIIMLEPRRIAAVSAARWMARTLGEEAGGTVGYTIRFDSRVSARTRIEVVTEGVLTRRLQADPGLGGTALVIFDEFHERSIHSDLGLALTLESCSVLRPDLRIVVMSATLDVDAVASLLDGALPSSPAAAGHFSVHNAKRSASVDSLFHDGFSNYNLTIVIFCMDFSDILQKIFDGFPIQIVAFVGSQIFLEI